MIQTIIKRQTAYYTFLCSFGVRYYLNILFLRFWGCFWVFMAAFIFSFLKHFLFFQTLATTDVKLYRRTNAPTSGSFTAQTSKDFPFTWSVEAIKSPKLQMKVLFSALKVTIPSSWNYLMWTALRTILRRKITKLNHFQMKLIYINS